MVTGHRLKNQGSIPVRGKNFSLHLFPWG